MCGCCSRAASVISRLNRSADRPAASSGASTLITTGRRRAFSDATKTRDMPPRGNSRSIVYFPTSAACTSSCNESCGIPVPARDAGVPAVGLALLLPELLPEERDRFWPRLLCRRKICRTVILSAQEAVSCAVEDVILVRLSQPFHRGIRGRNRRVDARVAAAVETKHRHLDGRHRLGVRR